MSPNKSGYRYPWPASQLDAEAMKLLYLERARLAKEGIKRPITILIKEAVEQTYGDLNVQNK